MQSPTRTAQAIQSLTLNYSRARKKRSGIPRHGWVKPKENYVKLNVDAGFCIDSGTGTTGAIIRDDGGFCVAASNYGVPFVSDPPTAEAQPLQDGLILAGQVTCNKLEVNYVCMK